MMRISDESYERVNDILDDIGYACDTSEYYEEWEEVARSSYATVLDDLDTEQFDMTCAAIKEKINDIRGDDEDNYARGIRTSFYGYLIERRDYLYGIGYYDEPDEPDDTEDEDEMNEYREAMERYGVNKAYTDVLEKWYDTIADMVF